MQDPFGAGGPGTLEGTDWQQSMLRKHKQEGDFEAWPFSKETLEVEKHTIDLNISKMIEKKRKESNVQVPPMNKLRSDSALGPQDV